ncbi:hypothetical protein [Pseudomonas panipatensis]|uniref:Uncharacterized protein n=1 Tax=Pseudomonas panipatensis TaxID=428992 RepID=A0A1G8CU16_9PSED|nr:hypothetical protein [Pseudomonas panipatensis]SDH48753.1 hypothetical protein SAMN05216272_101762 [Pseudomonas panipatensis]SMP63577.1 hypothetical protein SAMN06295951_10680 [Pseudomonas panipatensis]
MTSIRRAFNGNTAQEQKAPGLLAWSLLDPSIQQQLKLLSAANQLLALNIVGKLVDVLICQYTFALEGSHQPSEGPSKAKNSNCYLGCWRRRDINSVQNISEVVLHFIPKMPVRAKTKGVRASFGRYVHEKSLTSHISDDLRNHGAEHNILPPLCLVISSILRARDVHRGQNRNDGTNCLHPGRSIAAAPRPTGHPPKRNSSQWRDEQSSKKAAHWQPESYLIWHSGHPLAINEVRSMPMALSAAQGVAA